MQEKTMLVFLGSPRKKGNSATLAGEAVAGAREAGAKVEIFYLNGMTVKPCQGCDSCRRKGAEACVQKDDMRELYPKLRTADSILIAGPVYWFTVSAQTKLFMDRLYALGSARGHALKGKRVGIILTYADEDAFSSGAVNALRTFEDAFGYIEAEIVGMVHGSAWKAGEIRTNKTLMKKARSLGKKLVAAFTEGASS